MNKNHCLLFFILIFCLSSCLHAMIVKTTVTIDDLPRKAYHHTFYDLIATADHIIIDCKFGEMMKFEPSTYRQYTLYKELYRKQEAAKNATNSK